MQRKVKSRSVKSNQGRRRCLDKNNSHRRDRQKGRKQCEGFTNHTIVK